MMVWDSPTIAKILELGQGDHQVEADFSPSKMNWRRWLLQYQYLSQLVLPPQPSHVLGTSPKERLSHSCAGISNVALAFPLRLSQTYLTPHFSKRTDHVVRGSRQASHFRKVGLARGDRRLDVAQGKKASNDGEVCSLPTYIDIDTVLISLCLKQEYITSHRRDKMCNPKGE